LPGVDTKLVIFELKLVIRFILIAAHLNLIETQAAIVITQGEKVVVEENADIRS
jgi:hypothetical protein